MNILRVPKSLDLSRSCYFELPVEVKPHELNGYAEEYKRQYGQVFHSRIGHHIIFRLRNSRERDKFLLGLEMGCHTNGIIVKSLTYYSAS